jgi:metalloendopeptidase OMA1, mitochondrial
MCCTSRYIVAYSSDLVIHDPCRMEIEADHVGLLLLVAAGYDPRVAPSVYEKLGKIGGDSALNNYLSTHPSSKKRAQLLSQAHVMNDLMFPLDSF